MISVPAPADTYSKCTGCSITAPRRMRTYAPSSHRAVFNAANTSRRTSAYRPRCCSIPVGRAAIRSAAMRSPIPQSIACSSEQISRPFGRFSDRRKFRRKVPVHKNKLAGCASPRGTSTHCGGNERFPA